MSGFFASMRRAARSGVCPVDFYNLPCVLEGWKGRYHVQCIGIHNIPCIANIDITTGKVIQYPAFPLTIGLAGALSAVQRGERHTSDEVRRPLDHELV